MLTFDKLKIVVRSTDFIDKLNLNKFQTIIRDGVVTQYRYQQTTPYILYIEKDLVDNAEARVAKSVRDLERLAFMEKYGNDMKAI